MKDRYADGMDCQTCGMHVAHPAEYHPYIFCELFKLGHSDPRTYLEMALPGALLLMPEKAGAHVTETHEIVTS
jgi:hypothetical protein